MVNLFTIELLKWNFHVKNEAINKTQKSKTTWKMSFVRVCARACVHTRVQILVRVRYFCN